MISITIANHKGGSTKTTTSLHLAVGLARRGYRVLVIDNDAQGSATRWFGVEQPTLPDGEWPLCIVDVMLSPLLVRTEDQVEWEELIQETNIEHLSLLPSTEKMQEVDPKIMEILQRALQQDPTVVTRLKNQRLDATDLDTMLLKRLPDLPPKWDFCVIDTPPGMNLVTRNSLVATDWIIIPIDMAPLTLDGTGAMMNYMRELEKRNGKKLHTLGVLATVVEGNTVLSQKLLNDLHSFFVENLFGTKIRKTVKMKEASGFQQPAYDYAPEEMATYEYDRFCDEVLARLKARGVAVPDPPYPAKEPIPLPRSNQPKPAPKKGKPRRKSMISTRSTGGGSASRANMPAQPVGASEGNPHIPEGASHEQVAAASEQETRKTV